MHPIGAPLRPTCPSPYPAPNSIKHRRKRKLTYLSLKLLPTHRNPHHPPYKIMSDSSNQTLNVPSLLLVLVLLFLTLRYFFFAPSSREQEPPGSLRHGSGPDPAQVDRVESMFPQFSRREIMWDLQRNGGSMPATTERILAGRGLDVVCLLSLSLLLLLLLPPSPTHYLFFF